MSTPAEAYAGPRCRVCGGPAWQWRGSVHGFTCATCISRHLEDSAARADAADRKNRDRLVRNLKSHSSGRAASRGGGSDSYCAAPPFGVRSEPLMTADDTREDQHERR